MASLEGFQSAGFREVPTAREIGVRQALHIYAENSVEEWVEKNIAVVQRRSAKGALAQFIAQLPESAMRQSVLASREEVRQQLANAQRMGHAMDRKEERMPPDSIMQMLSPFQRRMFVLLWDHEGIPLSHAFLNTWCSRSKNEQWKEEGGGKVLHSARRNLRKKLRALEIGELFTIQDSGVLFLSPDRSGLPANALHKLKGADGIHGLNYDVLRQYAPNTAPFEAFGQALGEVGRAEGGQIAPQELSKKMSKLNKIDTGGNHFVVQAEQKRGYRMLTWNEIPEQWLTALKQLKLQVRESDLLLHFLSREGQLITPEEIIALLGKPDDKKLNNGLRSGMSRFEKQVGQILNIDTVHAQHVSGKPVLGYRGTVRDPELIARPMPIEENYLRLVRRNLLQQSPAMEKEFAAFDPAKYDEWARLVTVSTQTTVPVSIAPTVIAQPVVSPPEPKDEAQDHGKDPDNNAAEPSIADHSRPSIPTLVVEEATEPDELDNETDSDDEIAAWTATEAAEAGEKEIANAILEEAAQDEDTHEEPEDVMGEDAYIAFLKSHGIAPSDPTDALPGSAEKVAVIRWRMEEGVPIWHPLDRMDYSQGLGSSED